MGKQLSMPYIEILNILTINHNTIGTKETDKICQLQYKHSHHPECRM